MTKIACFLLGVAALAAASERVDLVVAGVVQRLR